MAARTSIGWTRGADGSKGATWNPIRALDRATGKKGHHCEHVNDACRWCYAEVINNRLGTGHAYRRQDRDNVEIFLDRYALEEPLGWRRPRYIFPCSMTDLFGPFVSEEMIDDIMAVMALAPRHTFQVLTKRPKAMRRYFVGLPGDRKDPEFRNGFIEAAAQRIDFERSHDHTAMSIRVRWPLPNVWLGTTIHDPESADEFIPHLLLTPARVHFLSIEPLLQKVDIRWALSGDPADLSRQLAKRGHVPTPFDVVHSIDWVIVGGESGPNARSCDLDGIQSIIEQCAAVRVPCFVKQLGRRPVLAGTELKLRDLKGDDPEEWPEHLRVQQMPVLV